jgi:hypothetical protein
MSTQVTVNNVRLAYMHLIEPHAAAEGAEPKYSVSMIIPKENTDAVNAVKNAMVAARDLKWGKVSPKGLRSPLRDGDEKDEEGNFIRPEEFRNSYYVGASSKRPVDVKIVMGGKIVNCPQEHMVSGYYGSVQANFYGYDAAGNKGVSAGLNGVMITKRGEPLGRKTEWDDASKAGAEDFGGVSAPVAKVSGFDAPDKDIPF